MTFRKDATYRSLRNTKRNTWTFFTNTRMPWAWTNMTWAWTRSLLTKSTWNFKILSKESYSKLQRHITNLQTNFWWMAKTGVKRSNLLYNSPFLHTKKHGQVLQIIQDFRELNQNSHIDIYLMKETTECIGHIGGANSRIFTTLDLTSGFWQMKLDEDSQNRTAFTISSKGQFNWITSPMGLLGCPASFQRLMEGHQKFPGLYWWPTHAHIRTWKTPACKWLSAGMIAQKSSEN